VGEFFGVVARSSVIDVSFELEDTFNKVHNLVNTALEGCCYERVHEEYSCLCFNYAFPNPLDHTHVSPMFSQPSISPKYSLDASSDDPNICDFNVDLGSVDHMFNMLGGNVDNFLSLGYFCGYDASLDPYCIFLVDKPRKIMWNSFFAFCFDFSISFALLKRALTFFSVIIFMLSYCHA